MEIFSDWADYNKSLIYSLSDEYYKEKGIDAYLNKSKNAIPNSITNSYPHAKAVAKLVKANLVNYPNDKKIKVLECGAGSGIFARNLLLAMQELKILDRVEYLISDLSRLALSQVKEKNVLFGFTENEHYKFIELNLYEIDQCKDLNGQAYKIEDISVGIFNYVYDALEMIVLRENQSNQRSKYEKLQLKFSQADKKEESNQDILSNTSFLKDLIKEERWKNYSIDQQSEMEQKYYKILEQAKPSNYAGHIYYSYGVLGILENLLGLCNENAFVLGSDMPNNYGAVCPYMVYGNTTAHAVDGDMVARFSEQLGYSCFRSSDTLMRLLTFKNKNSATMFKETYEDLYILNNEAAIYVDLRNAINIISSNYSHEILKGLVDKLLQIENTSAIAYISIGKYFELMGNHTEALNQYKKAKVLDFFDDFGISGKIEQLEDVCASKAKALSH